ncbi:YcxB family protein [Paracoccus sp. S1E-3]|uniref:YcxB family protein n=1 Tax=Paracoccus sp. S1E-3 TaxID=2756130 RepID=UPI0015EE3CDC|nr:YcxB family protein [Paracoccus sp. S1E-3]MBA4491953.1 YcxB family protein [Paracoccus sp. S1E-3]
MAAPYSFSVTYDGRVVRDAVRTFILRRSFHEHRALWMGVLVVLIFLWWRLQNGHRGWTEVLIGTVLLLLPVLVLVIWSVHARNSLRKLYRIGAPEVGFVLDERGIFAASDQGEALIPWDRVTEVWQRPESRMIFTGSSRFILLPTRDVPEEALRYLRRYLDHG